MPRVNLIDFGGTAQRGLWISGPRERTPIANMRRLTGVNNLRERELRSRTGTVSILPAVLAAHSVTRFDDLRFQGATTVLYRSGISIDTGYDGTPLGFIVSEPRVGTDAEYLFVCGGGKLTKVQTVGTGGAVEQWGIAKPSDAEWGTSPGGNAEKSTSTTVFPPQTSDLATTDDTTDWTTDAGSVILSTSENVPSPSGLGITVTVTRTTNVPTGDPNDEEGTEES